MQASTYLGSCISSKSFMVYLQWLIKVTRVADRGAEPKDGRVAGMLPKGPGTDEGRPERPEAR